MPMSVGPYIPGVGQELPHACLSQLYIEGEKVNALREREKREEHEESRLLEAPMEALGVCPAHIVRYRKT